MRENLRDYLYGLSSGTIAVLIGSGNYNDIDDAFNRAIDKADDLGILYSFDWTPNTITDLFRKGA